MKNHLLFACVFAGLFMLMRCGGKMQPSPPIPVLEEVSVGGSCDRCETMYEGMPSPNHLSSRATIASPDEAGEQMEIHGRVLQSDGVHPASGIVLYMYHTDNQGKYTPSDTQTVGRLHGHLRGWVITDSLGAFSFRSIRPAPYPDATIPAHLHFLVKEPGKSLYYIDEVWFADDSLVTPALRAQAEKRGGDLIIPMLQNDAAIWEGKMEIVLGRNIPGYR